MIKVLSKIKLRLKQKHCFKAHKRNGYSTPDGMCEDHNHNGEAYRRCSVCPYFAERIDLNE